jgi:hypothetical protein
MTERHIKYWIAYTVIQSGIALVALLFHEWGWI